MMGEGIRGDPRADLPSEVGGEGHPVCVTDKVVLFYQVRRRGLGGSFLPGFAQRAKLMEHRAEFASLFRVRFLLHPPLEVWCVNGAVSVHPVHHVTWNCV